MSILGVKISIQFGSRFQFVNSSHTFHEFQNRYLGNIPKNNKCDCLY
ncbi:hypothetical protein BCAH820_B0233 (plasmid) [Bacillus cereus AH820]|uniref:Uncharacterized protein n=1 Tax=Bacillus cereus (strain AH820) TaxID=405535 RepID=B7JTY1_BACC0|nr:hypothetical protein BCAH820_B0233 [Bacillus cereus AH820]